MMERLKRVGGVLGMGVIWAAVWAAVGALIGVVDSSRTLERVWLGPAIGMLPGFLGGLSFSALLAIAAGGRRLREVPLTKVVVSGAAAGLVVGMLPFMINEPRTEAPLWLVGAVVIGSMTLLSVLSAAGSRALVRRAKA
ncbi:MAG TPA: hypothetical protein VFP10_08705 [Candidatus Eisenbacteria bacterium]|nr:hypothetical protein [Candidatus Eisenbacteria bacterium]